ncbi:MAG: DUF559 domain-containing protein [Actinomycetota bacterium]
MSTSARASIAACMRIAASQYGVIARAQTLAAGLSRTGLHRLLDEGAWTRVRPGVYSLWRPSGELDLWRQRLSAATLWLGPRSAVSHRASLLHWELDGMEAAPLELSTEGHRRSHEAGLVIHRVASLPLAHVASHQGLPVTSVARTLVDVATIVGPSTLELAYESARRRGLVTGDQIEDVLRRLGGRRRGRAAIRRLLEELPAKATESALETLVWQLFREQGLPLPARQLEIRDPTGAFVARVDFAYPEARLVIEADGRRYHSLDPDWNRDRRRQNELTRLGWTVYRVTWRDVWNRAIAVAAEIAELYEAGMARTGGAVTTTVR